MRTKINLRASVDEVSYEYVSIMYREFFWHETGLTCYHASDNNKWMKFFPNGTAAYCYDGDFKHVMHFKTYQDCIDFARL